MTRNLILASLLLCVSSAAPQSPVPPPSNIRSKSALD